MQRLLQKTNIVPAVLIILIMFGISIPSYAGVAEDIQNLQSGEWYEIPNSHMRSVAYNWGSSGEPGYDFSKIIVDWNGGAFDTKNNRLLVWGGGHYSYGGNEIYGFDFGDFSWHRISEPSSYNDIMYHKENDDGMAYYPDGLPASRHTYNEIVYSPYHNSLMAVQQSASWWDSGNHDYMDYYAFEENTWHTNETATCPSTKYSAATVDPNTGHIWVVDNRMRNLYEYDPQNDKWINRGGYSSPDYNLYGIAAIDPKRNLLVHVGNDEYNVWNIDSSSYIDGKAQLIAESSSGIQDVVQTSHPTLAYDPYTEQMISWQGGTYVYSLNLDTHTWSKINAADTNTVSPTDPSSRGTFGRWRYVPSANVFTVVNSVDENVFVYRYSDTNDTTSPTVDTFDIPSTSSSKTFDINSFNCTDNVRVTYYQITQNSTKPASNEPDWTQTKPSFYTVNSSGSYTLYAWCKDLSNNVSPAKTDSVEVAADDTPPSVDSFAIPSSSDSLTFSVDTFSASDNAEVTGYVITESSTQPSAGAKEWSSSPPQSFTAAGCNNGKGITVYAWAKDVEGNISNPASQSISIDLGHDPNALLVGPYHTYKTIADAVMAAGDEAVIEVDAATYRNDFFTATQKDLVIRGVGGKPHLIFDESVPKSKGAVRFNGGYLKLQSMEISGAYDSEGNGAGIWVEGTSYTDYSSAKLEVVDCYLHDNENGLLTANSEGIEVVVNGTEFYQNGVETDYLEHNMYIGTISKFTLKNSLSHKVKGQGHEVKTRAKVNHILYNKILNKDGTSSSVLDIANAGTAYVIGNVFQEGPGTDNEYRIIDFGVAPDDKQWPTKEFYLINNTFMNNSSNKYFVQVDDVDIYWSKNNLFVDNGSLNTLYHGIQPTSSTNNLHVASDPGFVDMQNHDYHLTSTASSVIDSGQSPGQANGIDLTPQLQYLHPTSSEDRPSDGNLDIGAFEFTQETQSGLSAPQNLHIE